MNYTFLGPDFHHETPPRPIGTETEYTIPIGQPPRLSSVSTLNPLKLHSTPNLDEVWLKNGDMLYLDTPTSKTLRMHTTPEDILEYVTAECIDPMVVAAHEKIGETVVDIAARQMLYDAGHAFEYPAYKRTAYAAVKTALGETILTPMSTGYHENYSTPLQLSPLQRSQFLSYMVGRNIWAGAGIVTSNGFRLWQKAEGISFDPSNSGSNAYRTHGEKAPLFHKYQRLELRMGDANMSPWVTKNKLAVTSLVLRLVEHGAFPEEYTVIDGECQAIIARNGSKNPDGPSGVTGVNLSPLQHHRAIVQAAYDFALQHDVPPYELEAAAEVLSTLNLVERFIVDDTQLDAIAPVLDWAAKLRFIQQSLGRSSAFLQDYTTKNLDMVKLDLCWEAIADDAPSAKYYSEVTNTIPFDVLKAAYTAPADTRAGARTKAVQDLQSEGHVIDAMTWDGIIYDNGMQTKQLHSVYTTS